MLFFTVTNSLNSHSFTIFQSPVDRSFIRALTRSNYISRFIMRKLVFKALASALILASVTSVLQAATTTNNFNVTVTLTSQCQVTNNGTQTVAFGTYTAFQVAALPQTTSATLNFRCTRGYAPISTAFDVVLAPDSTAAGVGVIQGLQYTLTNTPVLSVAGTPASSTTIGTGDIRGYTITGSMPADQAGTCATASCGPTTQVRALIVTF